MSVATHLGLFLLNTPVPAMGLHPTLPDTLATLVFASTPKQRDRIAEALRVETTSCQNGISSSTCSAFLPGNPMAIFSLALTDSDVFSLNVSSLPNPFTVT